MEIDYDVVVVGYGPVGQLLALLLGRAGHRVAVVERWTDFYPRPRAAHFDHEIARILQNVGLRPDESAAIEPYDDLYAWRNAAGDDLLVMDRSGVAPTGWHSANFFVQPLLETELDQLVRAQPTVSVQRGWEVTGISDDPGAPLEVVLTSRPDGAERRLLRARYVVGADGANSVVRGVMGVDQVDLGYFFDWLVVDVVVHGDAPRFDPPAWQLCDPARPTTLVPGGPGRRRWEFMRLPDETREELDRAERAWELLAPWGVHPDNATLERHAVYTFQARWAREWRRGRLMIAGDAAHLMPPFAGLGMCAGLRDAMNLGWKLDLVLRGATDDALLGTVETERIPHVRHFIDLSMALGQVICITDPDEAAARDARMLAERADPTLAPPPPPPPRLGAGVAADGDDAAGHVSIQAVVTSTSGTGLFDDVVGPGALIIRQGSAMPDAHRQEALAHLGVAVVGLGFRAASGVVVDDTGAYASWLDELGADAVLVRPDFAVHGTVARGENPARLVDAFLVGCSARGPMTGGRRPAVADELAGLHSER